MSEQRCSDCGGELSYCGDQAADGPSLDCLACRRLEAIQSRDAEIARLKVELDFYKNPLSTTAELVGGPMELAAYYQARMVEHRQAAINSRKESESLRAELDAAKASTHEMGEMLKQCEWQLGLTHSGDTLYACKWCGVRVGSPHASDCRLERILKESRFK